MRLYEFICSWKIENGIQFAYVKCNAKNQKDAEGLIHMYIPFHIELGRVKIYDYSKQTGEDIVMWYFDKENKEHRNIYRGARI